MAHSKRMRCDQCEALMINGVFCHETGCPNTNSRFDDGVWIKQRECFDCGCTVDADDPCCSLDAGDGRGSLGLRLIAESAPSFLTGLCSRRFATWRDTKMTAASCFTIVDAERNYRDTREALASNGEDELAKQYHEYLKASFDRIFGNNAKTFFNLICDELTRRGITELPNIFWANTG